MRFLNLFRPLDPKHYIDADNKPATFWCSDCDGKVVKADDPTTGQFFDVNGHKYLAMAHCRDEKDPKTPAHAHIGDDWPCVIFALCSECLDRTGFRDIVAEP